MAFCFSSTGGLSLKYFRSANVDARYVAWYMALNSSVSACVTVCSCLVDLEVRLNPYRRMHVSTVRVIVFLFSVTVDSASGASGFTSASGDSCFIGGSTSVTLFPRPWPVAVPGRDGTLDTDRDRRLGSSDSLLTLTCGTI